MDSPSVPPVRAAACLALLVLAASCQQAPAPRPPAPAPAEDLAGEMRHIHILVDHVVEMTAEALELARMPDRNARKQSRMLLEAARSLLARAMTGREMAELHRRGLESDPLMLAVHRLAEETRKLMDLAERKELRDGADLPGLAHVLGMAAKGSMLVLIGQSEQGGDIDTVLVNHGQEMLGQASRMLEAAGGGDYRPVVGRIVNLLAGMPPAGEAQR